MTTIKELIDGLEQVDIENLVGADVKAIDEVIDFLDLLPHDLDTASGVYYMNKERKANDTGMDYRVEVHTYVDSDYSGYDEEYDEEEDYPRDYGNYEY